MTQRRKSKYSTSFHAARTVGEFMPKLTRKSYEKFGFPAAALLTDWENIVGEQMARFTEAERIKWPPRPAPLDESEFKNPPKRAGAQLIIRVEGPGALEIQHQSDQIIERINQYFGYKAVSSLRFLQAPLRRPIKRNKPKPKPKKIPPPPVDLTIENNDQLQTALEKLWAGMQQNKDKNK